MFPNGLTPEQQAAVDHDGGHLLVVAGAGTGKTTTLAARLGALVAGGADPSRVLLLTFSRRAAAELLHRAEVQTGQAVAASVWGGTFHAVANRLLRRHGRALGLDPSFTVLDQADTADLLALAREETDSTAAEPGAPRAVRRARKDTLAAILSRCVNTATPLSEVLRSGFPWCAEERPAIKAAFEAYTATKRRQQVLDFDDLLLCWGALLRIPDTAAALRGQFDHILVDEYQDTNALQADILDGMAAGGAAITAVGDDAQAIYSFRSATQRNILEFPDRFGARVVLLQRNHRSTPAILDCTNAVIAEARHRHPKTLWSARPDGPPPHLVRCADEHAQAATVCDRILHHLERGTPLRAQAVLFRTGHHSDVLEVELALRNVPFTKFGGLRFLEAAHVKDFVCTLRLVENPADEVAWFRVLQLVDGVGPSTARRLSRAEHEHDRETVAADLCTMLVEARTAAIRNRPGAQVDRARLWLDPVIRRRYPRAEPRVADLDQLGQAAAASASLSRFLVDLAIDPPASTGDLAGPPHLDEDWLTLSTIHSAKGGEWDVVHVIHVTDGNIPSDMATGDDDGIEEERRLLYVAMTRARDHLHCYAPLRYHHTRRPERHSYAQLSRFLTSAVLERFDDEPAMVDEPGAPDSDVAEPHPQLAAVDAMVSSLWD
jgi:DNA helicase-2/ATP-dependent DNA helicase PcrA